MIYVFLDLMNYWSIGYDLELRLDVKNKINIWAFLSNFPNRTKRKWRWRDSKSDKVQTKVWSKQETCSYPWFLWSCEIGSGSQLCFSGFKNQGIMLRNLIQQDWEAEIYLEEVKRISSFSYKYKVWKKILKRIFDWSPSHF